MVTRRTRSTGWLTGSHAKTDAEKQKAPKMCFDDTIERPDAGTDGSRSRDGRIDGGRAYFPCSHPSRPSLGLTEMPGLCKGS